MDAHRSKRKTPTNTTKSNTSNKKDQLDSLTLRQTHETKANKRIT